MKKPIRHKFNAIPTTRDGYRFDSTREARYYDELRLRKKAGEVVFFLRQVPLHVPGNITMRIDFLEFWADGTVHFVEVKGMKTKLYKTKKKLIETHYPITIEEK